MPETQIEALTRTGSIFFLENKSEAIKLLTSRAELGTRSPESDVLSKVCFLKTLNTQGEEHHNTAKHDTAQHDTSHHDTTGGGMTQR